MGFANFAFGISALLVGLSLIGVWFYGRHYRSMRDNTERFGALYPGSRVARFKLREVRRAERQYQAMLFFLFVSVACVLVTGASLLTIGFIGGGG